MVSFSKWLTMVVLIGLVASNRAETPLNETRSSLEKWVETRQLISQTHSDWQSDKEMLEQSKQLYVRELKSIEEQMTKLGTNSTQVEKERMQAEGQLQASRDSLAKAGEFVTGFEGRLKNVVPRLPAPLQDLIKPLLGKLPADPANTRMLPTERVQVVVGILNEVDKFNNAVSVFSEKRKNDKGEEIAVETVYVGLGAAYFVNEAGDFAGTGTPGPAGWEWTSKPEIGVAVKEVVGIYRNEKPARFVSLPAGVR